MARRLRNITVTLEEAVARWARLEAARREMSVSRLLGAILKERMREKNGYQDAMRRALTRKPFLKTDGQYPRREEVHDRARLR
jgi:predicted DNA-binding ribbon-helix-helix protein